MSEPAEKEAVETSLFGVEAPSEAELSGVEESGSESLESSETATSQPTDDNSGSDQSGDDAGKAGAGSDGQSDVEPEAKVEDAGGEDAGKEADKEPDGDKTPPGFVDLRALHAERAKRQSEKLANQELLKEIADLKASQAKPDKLDTDKDTDGAEFKRLNDDEFAELAEEDPVEASIYLQKQSAHDSKKAADVANKAAADRDAETRARATRDMGSASRALMGEAIPGFFDTEKTANSDLVSFAQENGFSDEMLALTIPETMILAPGSDKPQPMGEMAAHLVIALNNMRVKMSSVNPETIEADVTARVTAELMKKMRTGGDDSGGVSFMDSPGGSSDPTQVGKVLTANELSKLTTAESDAYLAGT